LAAAVQAGRLSALTAAVELGWVERAPVTGISPNKAKRRELALHALRREGLFGTAPVDFSDLGYGELQELSIGPGQMGSCFRDRQELEKAWVAAREELLGRSQPGRRPQAWWQFDAPDGLEYPGHDLERSTLWRLGLLSEAERATLEAEWKAEFDVAHAPDFAIAKAWPEGLVTGARARREHMDWADVPQELRERWRAERRQRPKPAA
jgi:hypothetical protein